LASISRADVAPFLLSELEYGTHTHHIVGITGGTHVRMEQSGFRPEQEANYQGAMYGWQRFIGGQQVVAQME